MRRIGIDALVGVALTRQLGDFATEQIVARRVKD